MRVREFGGVAAFTKCPSADLLGALVVESGGGCDLFHRDITAEKGIAGQPDGAHAAAADFGSESVPPCQQVFRADAPPCLLSRCHHSRLED
jgi:hypothetical protein